MPPLFDIPDQAPQGSFHLLQNGAGETCVGRFIDNGWVKYVAEGEPVSGEHLRAAGCKLVRSILEGRRVLSGD